MVQRAHPQRLKPEPHVTPDGTAEAVPFPNPRLFSNPRRGKPRLYTYLVFIQQHRKQRHADVQPVDGLAEVESSGIIVNSLIELDRAR